MAQHKKTLRGNVTVDGLIEQGIILCGTPETVIGKLREAHKLLGFANFLALLQFGTLPRELTEKNIRLFAREVMPALQGLTDDEFAGTTLLTGSTR
jgi:alkanesulfonate monooxygenase SsuD/methylene tetrahydromethanopterin reductase-like flavin-dependent oxidoreductase (luciferase family)